MTATAIFLHFRSRRYRQLLLQNAASSFHFSSSSSSNSDDDDRNLTSPSQPNVSSRLLKAGFKRIERSNQQLPKPSIFSRNPSTPEDPTQKAASINEIRKNLFRGSSVQPPQSTTPAISFLERYNRSVMPKADPGSGSENASKREPDSLEAIMMLKAMRLRPSQSRPESQPGDARPRTLLDEIGLSLKLKPKNLNDMSSSMPESTGKNKKGLLLDETKTDSVSLYSHGDTGEELRKLGTDNKNTKFPSSESNERPPKLQGMEEKKFENEHLMDFLIKLKGVQKTKKNAVELGETPRFMLSPPKEVLVEKYFHPDHMSLAEKQKLELKNVRDKTKISESDTGSASVQGMVSHKRNYRVWSNIEDAKLVEALVNMVNIGGFKYDNGFKRGYLVRLEQSLKKSLPESGVLGKNHIQARLRTIKKDWQAVFDMLNANSGFGYDKERKCVTANAPGVWESYLENHKCAAKWTHKKLPHYEELCVIFGKDRAQDNRAKSVTKMEAEVNMEEQEQERDNVFDEVIGYNRHECTNTSVHVEETSNARIRKRGNGNKSNPLPENFNGVVTLYVDGLEESVKELSEGIRFEVDLEEKTAMITNELSKMTSLTQWERFTAIKKIKSDRNNVITFWDLSEEEREDWARFLMWE